MNGDSQLTATEALQQLAVNTVEADVRQAAFMVLSKHISTPPGLQALVEQLDSLPATEDVMAVGHSV